MRVTFILLFFTCFYHHKHFASSALSGEYRTDLRTCSPETKNAHQYIIHPYTTDRYGNWLCRAHQLGQNSHWTILLTPSSIKRIPELEAQQQATVYRNKKTNFVESVLVYLKSCNPSSEELGEKIDNIMARMYASLEKPEGQNGTVENNAHSNPVENVLFE